MTLVTQTQGSGELQASREGIPSVERIREAIQSAYRHVDGQMVIKHVTGKAGTNWYRVNWYRQSDLGLFIHHSRFLLLRNTPEGLVVEDQTIPARSQISSN